MHGDRAMTVKVTPEEMAALIEQVGKAGQKNIHEAVGQVLTAIQQSPLASDMVAHMAYDADTAAGNSERATKVAASIFCNAFILGTIHGHQQAHKEIFTTVQ